ncbi:MAG TPA: hypothetical protein VMZ27_05950 [Candidatus Saccharimonadales bacterium]|nr:hypothetical protein [Candidatus Saccharimonadales bacterium]
MRIDCLLFFHLLLTSWMARAEEKLPTLRVGTVLYSNVTVMKVTATDVYFTFNSGMANAKLKNLDPVMQKHFNYDAAKVEALAAEAGTPFSIAPGSKEPVIDRSNVQAVRDDAIARVKVIVNQPVKQFTRTPGMAVSVYSPGWFHEGATEPDYKTVDVRSSQKTEYAQNAYVSSDLNPGVAFAGPEIEFNGNTKFFYTDRTLPKKSLSEAEMLEINRLYRIIAKCAEVSDSKPVTGVDPVVLASFATVHRKEIILGTGGLLLLLVLIRFVNRRNEAAG